MLHALEMVRDANRDDPHIPPIALATIEVAAVFLPGFPAGAFDQDSSHGLGRRGLDGEERPG